MTRRLIGLVSPAGETNAKIAAAIARQIAQAQVSREGQQADQRGYDTTRIRRSTSPRPQREESGWAVWDADYFLTMVPHSEQRS